MATVVEYAQQTGFDKFSEVLAREIHALRSELKIEIRDSRIDIRKPLTDQVWKIVGAVATIVTIAVAIIKVFPNASA